MGNKLIQGILAMVMVAGALMVSAPRADALVPIFPTCIKTQLDHETTRYWFDPGTLEGPTIRTVTVEGVDMRRRRDGIWVADAPRLDPVNHSYAYFHYNNTHSYGNWAKCARPKPRHIY